jgi:ketosteroid isomerase-like protein
MSQENVEIVRRFHDALRRGDHADALGFLAPDVAYKVAQEGVVHGPDAVRAVWERWESDWEDLEETTEELIDAGDHVILGVRFVGRGRRSGIEIGDRFFNVYTLRDGKIVRKVELTERSQALEAVGMSEQDAQAEGS